MIIRVRYQQRGGHVHQQVFMGRREEALALCGTLVMRDDEFVVFKEAMTRLKHVMLDAGDLTVEFKEG